MDMKTIRHMIKAIIMTGFLAALISGPAVADDYAHKITDKKVHFEWTVKGTSIDIRISAPTTGWVGIGFNPSEMMKDANFIVGYVKDGTAEVRDDYGKTNRTHESDTKDGGTDNVTAVSGNEANGTTTLSFTIPLNSGDSKDRPLDVNGDTTVLLAYGSGRDGFKSRHKEHFGLSVNLSTGEYKDTHRH